MPPTPPVDSEGIMFPVVRPAVVRPLTRISRDTISLHLVEGFQRNLTHIFTM